MKLVCAIFATFSFALLLSSAPVAAQDVPKDYQEVLTFLGRSGDFKAKVLKVNVPRNELTVTIAGQSTPTPVGFGGWVAMTKGEGSGEVLMGDLVLTQDEVNPVMSALLEHGIEVTALHNHFFFEEPRLFYMHVHGHGEAMNLALSIKPALDLIPKPPATASSSAPAAAPAGPAFNLVALDKIVGQQGESLGSVYKFTLGRDDLNLKEQDRKSTRLNSSHRCISYAVFCLKKKTKINDPVIINFQLSPNGENFVFVLLPLRESTRAGREVANSARLRRARSRTSSYTSAIDC